MASLFNNIIFIPHNHGQLKIGVEETGKIIKPLINDNIVSIHELDKEYTLENSLNNIYKFAKNLDYNQKPLFIGGDHSISMATIKAIYKKDMKIIWIDAHADINTIEASETKNYHGMPLSFLTGLEKNIINCNNEYHQKEDEFIVPFENIAYIGLRSVDPFEESIILKHNIKVIDYKSNIDYIQNELKEFIGDSCIHISLDVDVLDPEFMQCTGTLEKDGMSLVMLCSILNYLKNHETKSMDIVEFNHKEGTGVELYKSLKSLLEILNIYNLVK
tara:strand:- start:1769 stop:2590 length:822 start_codon:yes stop_codon:yes gene_type:complete